MSKLFKATALIVALAILAGIVLVSSPLVKANPGFTKSGGTFIFSRGEWAESPSVLFDSTENKYKMWYTQGTANHTTINNFVSAINALNVDNLASKLRTRDLSGIAATDSSNITTIIDYLAGLNTANVTNLLSAARSRTSYATSADGVNWTYQADVLALGASGQFDSYFVGDPTVIKTATGYEMWYTGVSLNVGTVETFLDRLAQLRSENVSTLMQDLIANNLSDFISHAVNAQGLGYMSSLLTDLINIVDGISSSIGRATSSDGITWTKTGVVLAKAGGTTAWDRHGVATPEVVKVDSTYHMWYTGFSIDYTTMLLLAFATNINAVENTLLSATKIAIGHATSADGITWARDGANPVVDRGASGAWDRYGVATPTVVYSSATGYQMWYTGVKLTPSTLKGIFTGSGTLDSIVSGGISTGIGHASSTNGVSWTKDSANPVLTSSAGTWDRAGVFSPTVIISGTLYKMWYTGGALNPASLLVSLLNGQSLANAISSGGLLVATGYATDTIPVTTTTTTTPPVVGGGGSPYTPPGVTYITNTDAYGTFLQSVSTVSDDSRATLTIPSGTLAQVGGVRLTQISMTRSTSPPALPTNFGGVGVTYTFGPAGATFTPPITLTMTYDPASIPAGVSEDRLFINQWDPSTGWSPLASTVDRVNRTIMAFVSHFSEFSVMVPTKPAAFTFGTLGISPAEVAPNRTVTVSLPVTNTGDLAGTTTVSMSLDGIVVASQSITLAGGETKNVTFTTSKDSPGTFTVTIGDRTGRFTVRAPTPAPTPKPVVTPTPTPAPTPKPVVTPPPTPTPTPKPVVTPPPTPTPTPAPAPTPGRGWLVALLIVSFAAIVAAVVWTIIRRRRPQY